MQRPAESAASFVSVIVTVRNDRAGILTLLDALRGQSRLPDEVVVVDGGSTDGTWESLVRADIQPVPLRVFHECGANIAEGRNIAVRHARGTIIACTDSGCVPDANWLEALIRPFADPRIAVVGGAYRVQARSRMERVAGALTLPGQLDEIDPARFNPSGRSMAFRRHAWSRAGGFPNWLYTAEDTLFGCKLRQLGMGFAFAGDAIVRWRPRSSWSGLWRQFAGYARGEGHLARTAKAAAFWVRRYVLAEALLAVAVICWAACGQLAALLTGIAGAAALLLGPLHRTAWRIAWRNNAPLDYPMALAVGHVVAPAGIVGLRRGLADRRLEPQRFVQPLVRYWGGAAVRDVPPWMMAEPAAPRTLVVTWHYPPVNRASSAVLAHLLQVASPAKFRVLTRDVTPSGDPLAMPPLCVTRVPWRGADEDLGLPTWIACVVGVARMALAGRRLALEWRPRRIMAVFPHRYSLLAGWLIARMTGVPLVAYMHDLCVETLITRSRVKRWFWQKLDERVVREAASMLAPTAEFAAHYRRRGARRVMVLPHVCARVDAAPLPAPADRLRLVYAGSTYQAHLDALAAFDRAIGTRADAEVTYLTNSNRVLPAERVTWLSREDAAKRMTEADALVVLLGAESPYPAEIRCCFPSKIVDYLGIGRPILALVPADSFVARFIHETGCGVAATDFSDDAILRAVDVLRDPQARQRMAAAAANAASKLDPHDWMRRLEVHLSGALALPATDAPPPDRLFAGFESELAGAAK